LASMLQSHFSKRVELFKVAVGKLGAPTIARAATKVTTPQ